MTLTSSAGRVPPRRGPGRPSTVDAGKIARAVLDVGFPALTFAAVAERLGVAPATLYRHAANRDELVRLGLDLALRSGDWPESEGEWRPMLERWAIASWRAWERHPGAVLEVARGIVPWSIVLISDRVGAELVARGFSPRAAVLAVDLVFDLAADSRRGVETLDAPTVEAAGGMRELIERQWQRPGATGHTAQVRAEMLRAIQTDPFDWFHRKLQVVLSGIESELSGTSVSVPAPAPDVRPH